MSTNCTYHCGSCGLHFHSLKAFDAHRQGDYRHPLGAEPGRHCIHPYDMEGRLVALTDDGECRTYAERRRGVTVWTHARDLERARRRSEVLPRSAQGHL